MENMLFWLYMTNAVLLINHEIDSAYWEEWKLFRLPGGIGGFLVIHFPLLFMILYGVAQVHLLTFQGLVISSVLSMGGLFAFSIHMYFIGKGHSEFRAPVSMFILFSTLPVSLAQGAITALLFLR
jgi:hypothetical protein